MKPIDRGKSAYIDVSVKHIVAMVTSQYVVDRSHSPFYDGQGNGFSNLPLGFLIQFMA